jgi:hypothetical protein
MLMGALVGTQVGLEGVPTRFPDGLADVEELLAMSKRIGTGI